MLLGLPGDIGCRPDFPGGCGDCLGRSIPHVDCPSAPSDFRRSLVPACPCAAHPREGIVRAGRASPPIHRTEKFDPVVQAKSPAGVLSVLCSALSGRSARAISLKHVESEDGIALRSRTTRQRGRFPCDLRCRFPRRNRDVFCIGPEWWTRLCGRLVPLPAVGGGAVTDRSYPPPRC